MKHLTPQNEQAPARMLAGALAHLATHMTSTCPRAAYLAAMLLEEIATDPRADSHLRRHARQLVDILERDPLHAPAHAPISNVAPDTPPALGSRRWSEQKRAR